MNSSYHGKKVFFHKNQEKQHSLFRFNKPCFANL